MTVRLFRTLTALAAVSSLAVLPSAGCKNSSEDVILGDAGVQVPKLRLDFPGHLQSNVPADWPVRFHCGVWTHAPALDTTTTKAIEAGFSLTQVGSGKVVAGAFTWKPSTFGGDSREVEFAPATKLAEGEYIANLGSSPLYSVTSYKATARFRVGSLPIVRYINFYLDDTTKHVNVYIHFSEVIQDPTPHISLQIDGKAVVPLQTKFSNGTFSIETAEPSRAKTYKITVKADVVSSTGVHLDGKNTGIKTASGTDFMVEVIPESLQKMWEATK